ncbi:MAG: hypothetical protein HUJ65_06095 [Oscillospiraceae bacterium]|nr:hypothetical protein [Oscillospiraceae bacterium]
MSVRRIKNVVIILLLVVNLAFVGLLHAEQRRESEQHELELEQLTELYAQSGVALSDEVEILPSLPTVSDAVDADAERDFAEHFLGATEAHEMGAGSLRFRSETGTAVFTGDGEFTISLTAGAVSAEQSRSWVERTLRAVKIDYALLDETADGFAATQSYGRTEITNCRINFIFTDGELTSVTGRLATSFERGRSSMSCVTAMTRFLSRIRSGAVNCSVVSSVRRVYSMHTTVSGGSLYGEWLIETDSGEYTVNAATGEILTKSK